MDRQMKQHMQTHTNQAGMPSASAASPANTPIFFYDGDFRTWTQIEQRAQLNMAIASIVSKNSVR